MSGTLHLRNRQRTRAVSLPLLRRLIRHLLTRHLQFEAFELCFHFIARTEMACLNQTFLQHSGSTDVITFDHSDFPGPQTSNPKPKIHGEIFISLDDAVAQAGQFHTTWQSELTRYIVHGLLHLQGFDDLQPAARRKMKREENRLLQALANEFSLPQLARLGPRTRAATGAKSRRFPLSKSPMKPSLAK